MAQHHALAVAELRVHCGDSSVLLYTLLLHRLHTAVGVARCSPIVTFLSVMFSYTKFSWAWHSAPQFSSCGQQMLHPPLGAHSRLLSAVQLFFHSLDLRIIFLPDCWAGPIQIANCSGASM